MRNLCDAAKMSCEVAALSFQAHANNGTWSIDFEFTAILCCPKQGIDIFNKTSSNPKKVFNHKLK